MSPIALPKPEEIKETADLQTVDFSKILIRDAGEVDKLVKACESDGFFYLDLRSRSSTKMFNDLHQLELIMTGWFSQPVENKKKEVENVSNAHGFKPSGVQSGVADNSKDGFEALKVARNELRGRWALPRLVQDHLQLFDDFSSTSHFILRTILDSLSDGLGLRDSERFDHHHRDDLPSKSTLYFLHYPESVTRESNEIGQNTHTDIGSLTLLFAPQWGLQVVSPSTGQWEWIEPLPRHAIINVADTLRFLSRKRFRSALHRATPIEGQGDRYSISYFLRAADTTEFQDSNGENASARDWYLKKYDMYEMPHEVQKQQTVLSGGMAQELARLTATQQTAEKTMQLSPMNNVNTGSKLTGTC